MGILIAFYASTMFSLYCEYKAICQGKDTNVTPFMIFFLCWLAYSVTNQFIQN